MVIPIREDFHHGMGAVHGAVYFKAMDDAAYFAVSSLVEDAFVLTVSFHVHFLRPVISGEMRAVGEVVSASPKLYVAEAKVYDSRGREIGRGSGDFVQSNAGIPAA